MRLHQGHAALSYSVQKSVRHTLKGSFPPPAVFANIISASTVLAEQSLYPVIPAEESYGYHGKQIGGFLFFLERSKMDEKDPVLYIFIYFLFFGPKENCIAQRLFFHSSGDPWSLLLFYLSISLSQKFILKLFSRNQNRHKLRQFLVNYVRVQNFSTSLWVWFP